MRKSARCRFKKKKPLRIAEASKCERNYKPGSVLDEHLSRPDVTAQVQAMPGTRRAASCVPLTLASGGVYSSPQLPEGRVSSYLAFPSLPAGAGGISLLHSPWSRLHRPLAGTLPYDARTFLIPEGTRSSGYLTGYMIRFSMDDVKGWRRNLCSPFAAGRDRHPIEGERYREGAALTGSRLGTDHTAEDGNDAFAQAQAKPNALAGM